MLVTAELPAEEFLRRYYSDAFAAACRDSPGYGRRWCCPPLPDVDLRTYSTALIVAFRLVTTADDPVVTAAPLLRRYTALLLGIERRSGGRAFGFCGMCRLCRVCTRTSGRPCRHSAIVRPPLEAFGFDLGLVADELLGMPLQWAPDADGNRNLLFIGAVFHTLPSAKNFIGPVFVN